MRFALGHGPLCAPLNRPYSAGAAYNCGTAPTEIRRPRAAFVVLARPKGVERADPIHIRIPIVEDAIGRLAGGEIAKRGCRALSEGCSRPDQCRRSEKLAPRLTERAFPGDQAVVGTDLLWWSAAPSIEALKQERSRGFSAANVVEFPHHRGAAWSGRRGIQSLRSKA